ncbi:hypothetical protein K7432_012705 [Basidiobolus ranarum]|uniref:Trafficking protein particle complex subunit 13 n=1 Tax=Basidiobolus ranarum TaxID=34480 RepID=A0ABR2WKD9_9FUNG
MATLQNQGSETDSHHVGLKLMRLSRPSLALAQPIFYENGTSSLAETLHQLALKDPIVLEKEVKSPEENNSSLKLRDLGLSETLLLPDSWGSVYLGEFLTCYLCLNNEDTESVRELGIKVELQTTSKRFPLADTTTSPLEILAPNKASEIVVQHEIKELGIHILVCSAQYLTSTGERKFIRKFYKFQIQNPLAVKTKVNNGQDGKILLEIQLQNVAASSMHLESLRFEPAEPFGHSDLNQIIPNMSHQVNEEQSSLFGVGDFLSPKDVRQYVYMLTPKSVNDIAARTTNALGKLDIIWRSALGEFGRLQTSSLMRKPPPLERIEVNVIEMPKDVYLEEPFRIQCRAINRTPAPMHLHLTCNKAKMGSILSVGYSSRNLGDVPPNGTVDFSLDFVPLAPGFQRIGGLRITDSLGGYAQDFDYFWDVFVCYSREQLDR